MSFEKEIHSEFWFPQQIIIYQDLKFQKIKSKFVDYCKRKQREDLNGKIKSNCLGWQSGNILTKDFVSDYLQESTNQSISSQFNIKSGTNFRIDNFWINISPKFASNDYHVHHGSHYSGCLYIQCDEKNSGSIKINPNINFNTDWMDFLVDDYKNTYHIHPAVE